MSAGPGTQAEPIQRNRSAKGPDASQHSALFYLSQEVSKLASPIHSPGVGPDSPGRWGDASPPGPGHSASPPEAPPHWTGVREQRPSSRPGPAGHSPWKVLSLINLQCQRLLHHSHAEEWRPSSSPLRGGAPQGAGTPTHGGGVGSVGSDPQLRVKEPDVSSLGKQDGAPQLHREEEKEESSRNGACRQDTEHLPRQNTPHSTTAPPGALLNTHRTPSSNTQVGLFLRKPEPTLDYNANLWLPTATGGDPCSQPDPLSQPAPAAAHQCTSTQGAHPPVEHGGSQRGATPGKPPRKQPHPRRSVDLHDPDLQGVMFRMDPELDHRGGQCRLLITSEFR